MNTKCEECIFSRSADSGEACEFGIIEAIEDKSKLSIKNNFYIINNYHCLYGFSKKQKILNQENLDIHEIDIKKEIENRATIKYYLVIDARSASIIELKDLIVTINSLSIKPQKVSIIINGENNKEKYDIIRKNISVKKWTSHIFITSTSFNQSINIILDTNLATSESWCLLFYDFSQQNDFATELPKLILKMHNNIIIQQKNLYGLTLKNNSLHGLCLNTSFYKFITSTMSNDILQGLSMKSDIILGNY